MSTLQLSRPADSSPAQAVKTITAAYCVLEAKGDTAKAQNLAPLEILLAGLSNGQNAMYVLPKLGFGNRVYQIFMYNLIFQ